MATDLTWQQLNDALPAGAIQVLTQGQAAPFGGLAINVSLVSGDQLTALSNQGVVETCLKLLQAANLAQTAANTGVASGSRLDAFPPSTSTTASLDSSTGSYYTTMTATVRARVPLDSSSAVGPTV